MPGARESSYSERPHTWVKPKHPIPCPRPISGVEHQLKTNARLQSHALLRCMHRPGGAYNSSTSHGECGAWVWVQMLPSGWRYVAVVTQAEVGYMEHRHMSVDEALTYLGTEIATHQGSS